MKMSVAIGFSKNRVLRFWFDYFACVYILLLWCVMMYYKSMSLPIIFSYIMPRGVVQNLPLGYLVRFLL